MMVWAHTASNNNGATSHVDDQYDVAIVGAGLAGSAMAAQLAAVGWRPLLLERDRFPRHKVCGEFLSPEVKQTLQTLDLYQTVAAQKPAELTNATLTSIRGHTLTIPLPDSAWGLSRHTLDTVLATAAVARGTTLLTDHTVLACERQADAYGLRVRQPDQQQLSVTARAVIMACGRHTRAGLPPRRPKSEKPGRSRWGQWTREQWRQGQWQRCVGIKLHYTQLIMPAQTELYLLPGGYVGLNPVEGGRANLCALLTYDAFADAGKAVPTAVAAMAAQHPALAARLAEAIPDPASICTVAPVDTMRRAQPWSDLPCVGDTAAMIPPLCGDGMAMALHGAVLSIPLADAYLRGRCSLAQWETAYRRAWQGAFGKRLRVGRALQRGLGWPFIGDLLLDVGRVVPGLATGLLQATRGPLPERWRGAGA